MNCEQKIVDYGKELNIINMDVDVLINSHREMHNRIARDEKLIQSLMMRNVENIRNKDRFDDYTGLLAQ